MNEYLLNSSTGFVVNTNSLSPAIEEDWNVFAIKFSGRNSPDFVNDFAHGLVGRVVFKAGYSDRLADAKRSGDRGLRCYKPQAVSRTDC